MSALTPLERELLRRIADDNWPGFRVDGLDVTKRHNTGAGRYVYVSDSNDQPLRDGSYAARNCLIEMEGVPNGLGFVIDVRGERIRYLEIFTYGDTGWDGVERNWKLV